MDEEWVSKQELETLLGKQERQAERTVKKWGIRKEVRDTIEGKKPFFSLADIQRVLNAGTLPKAKTPVVLKGPPRTKRRHLSVSPSPSPSVMPSPSSLEHKLFLTLKEAAFLSGLTEAFLERAIEARRLPAVRDVSVKINRHRLLEFCDDDAMTAQTMLPYKPQAKRLEVIPNLTEGTNGLVA